MGSEYSASRKLGLLNPDFEHIKAKALHRLGRTEEALKPIKHAYFGFILLGENEKAEAVVSNAEEIGISFNQYNVKTLDFSDQYRVPYKRGYPVCCSSIGSMIHALRVKANLSMAQLSRGICDKSSLSNIERDKWIGSFFNIEAIMQRLGRDICLYNNFFLSKKDFTAVQLRDKIYLMITEYKHKEALMYIKELESLEGFMTKKVNKQFLETARALICLSKSEEIQNNPGEMLLDALKITCPQFKECDIEVYSLTHNEVYILNQYASYLWGEGHELRAVNIFESLINNLSVRCVDAFEKARMYTSLLFNYSTALSRMGNHREALSAISECENFERRHGRLIDLPGISYNKGYNMLMLGKKAESFPYFILAYYGTSMFADYGQAHCLPIIADEIKEFFEIVPD